ncbi:hypothetical protein ACROYT_G021118 [Oculina patagonica]
MLTQAHLAPLTEENLKKHQKETTVKHILLKKTTGRRSKSGKSLRSAGDGESIEFVSDETLKASLDEQRGNEKETFPPVELPNDSTTTVALQNMNEHTETNPLPDSTTTRAETNSRAGSKSPSNEKEELSEEEKATEPSNQEKGEGGYDSENNNEFEKERSGIEEDWDESSSSSLESDSDVVVPIKANRSDREENVDPYDTAASTLPKNQPKRAARSAAAKRRIFFTVSPNSLFVSYPHLYISGTKTDCSQSTKFSMLVYFS